MAGSRLLALAAGAVALFAGMAQAADLPYRAAPPPPPPPVFTWTGGYLGSVVGVDFLNVRADPRCIGIDGTSGGLGCPIGATGQHNHATSYLLGATSGYNLQFGQVVLGIESDIQSTGLNSSKFAGPTTLPIAGGGGAVGTGTVFGRVQIDAFGTVRGRIGFAWGRTLLYATGGVIYANINQVSQAVAIGGGGPGVNFAFVGHSDSSRFGAVGGAGIEYAFTDRWSAKIEGLYYDLGSKSIVPGEIAGGTPLRFGTRFRTDGEMVRAGLNYRFGSLW